MNHVLACALCSPDGQGNPGTQFLAYATIVLLGIGCVCWVVRAVAGQIKGQPIASPRAASLLSGRNVPAYTAAVSAVTPSGVQVRWARCCPQGHQTPDQAVAHARAVGARISAHGR